MAYEKLIDAISSEPILGYPNFEKTFYVTTDASTEGIGGMLSQVYDGVHYPIAFYSRSLNKSEKNYPIYQLEGLAIKASLQKFRFYILGYDIVVRTDNTAILALLKTNQCEGTIGKYLAAILEFSPSFEYIPGKDNMFADFLSRNVSVITKTYDVIPDEIKSVDQIIKEQKQDKCIQKMFSNSKFKNKIVSINNLLYLSNDDVHKLIIPKSLQSIYLHYFHSVIGSHEGIKRSIERITKYIFWPSLVHDMRSFVHKCEACKVGKPCYLPKQVIGEFSFPDSNFKRVHVDLLGPLPLSRTHKKYIMVAIDSFSHWSILKAISNKESKTIVEALQTELIQKHKSPDQIVCDMGTEFTSEMFRDFCKNNNIDLHICAPYHHASNGQVERLNLQIENCLRCLIYENKGSWDQYVGDIMNSLNSTVHGTVGVTPYELVYGSYSPVQLPGVLNKSKLSDADFFLLHKHATDRLRKTKSKMGKVNKHRRVRYLNYNDKVFVKVQKPINKLKPLFSGPFRVVGQHSSQYSYDLKDDAKNVIYQVHINNIR